MPGFYVAGEYDVAGFAVGAVKQDRVIDGKQIKEGDVILGFASSGVHSNGFSLVRKILEACSSSYPQQMVCHLCVADSLIRADRHIDGPLQRMRRCCADITHPSAWTCARRQWQHWRSFAGPNRHLCPTDSFASGDCARQGVQGCTNTEPHDMSVSCKWQLAWYANYSRHPVVSRKVLQLLDSLLQPACLERACYVQGVVHITGGGFYENIPRILPGGLGCEIDRSAWAIPELFNWLQKVGHDLQPTVDGGFTRHIKAGLANTGCDEVHNIVIHVACRLAMCRSMKCSERSTWASAWWW